MAENNTTASQDLTCDGITTSMSNSRCALAIEAAEEIETLCEVLTLQTTNNCDVKSPLARLLSARISDLSTIVMAALGDPAEKTEEIAFRLRFDREAA